MALNKTCSFFLIALLLGGVAFSYFGVVGAESTPKPSVPEFTVTFVDASYDTPATSTYSTDQFTGKQVVTTQPGSHIQIKYLEVAIKNQPFAPTRYGNETLQLMFDVRWRGHFSESNYWFSINTTSYYGAFLLADQANAEDQQSPLAETTKMKIGFKNNNGTGEFGPYNTFRIPDPTSGGEVDVQVQAFIGYYTQEPIQFTVPPSMDSPRTYNLFHGQSSGWSSTQTLTIPKEASANTSPPTSTATETPDPSAALQNPTEIPARPVTESALPFGLDLRDFALVLLAVLVLGLFLVLWVMRSRIRGLERKQNGAE
ncbi:MAG: hypothetical protein NWE93_07200 [Candidatus Bathyarchaeota archaeon]|nr:hypothetical protein [Candidatus Bathyarchaeota archaeon]